jgi:hypothetical protein
LLPAAIATASSQSTPWSRATACAAGARRPRQPIPLKPCLRGCQTRPADNRPPGMAGQELDIASAAVTKGCALPRRADHPGGGRCVIGLATKRPPVADNAPDQQGAIWPKPRGTGPGVLWVAPRAGDRRILTVRALDAAGERRSVANLTLTRRTCHAWRPPRGARPVSPR